MISLDIDMHASGAMRRLAAMKTRAQNFAPVFLQAQKELEAANAANFASAGGASGGWNPLDPGYAAWKATRYPGAPIMVQTGRLFRSLVNLSGPPSFIRGTEAQFGTSVRYAKFHEYGTRHMPRREIVFQPPLFARRLAKKAAEYMADGIL